MEKFCRRLVLTSYHKLINCECRKLQERQFEQCCCPPPYKDKYCRGDTELVYSTFVYELNKTSNKCLRTVFHSRKTVSCPRTRKVLTGSCNQHTCRQYRTTQFFRVINCRCKPWTVINEKLTCCCPEEKMLRICHRHRGLLILRYTSFHLVDGYCQRRVLIRTVTLSCWPSQLLSKRNCRTDEKSRQITIKHWRRIGCECVPIIRSYKQLCKCPNDIIKEWPCSKGKSHRSTVHYKFVPNMTKTHCRRIVVRISRSPCCQARKATVLHSCSGQHAIMILTRYVQTKSHGSYRCIRLERRVYKRIKCQTNVTDRSYTQCDKYIQYMILKKQYVRNCKCMVKRIRTRKVRACDCWKLNQRYHHCDPNGNQRNFYHITYYADGPECKVKRHMYYEIIRLDCKKGVFRRVKVTPCVIAERNGVYRYENHYMRKLRKCRCIVVKKRVKTLCRCRKAFFSKNCVRNRIQEKRIKYLDVNGVCRAQVALKIVKLLCATRIRRSSKFYGCIEHFVQISHQAVGCRCVLKRLYRTRRHSCCGQFKHTRRICSDRSIVLLTKTVTMHMVFEGYVIKANGDQLPKFTCQKTTEVKKTHIVCPKEEVLSRKCYEPLSVYHRVKIYYDLEDCKCRPRKDLYVGRCRCKKTQIRRYPCVGHFRKLEKRYYVSVGKECLHRSKIRRERCSCWHRRVEIRCNGKGHKITMVTSFQLTPDGHCVRNIWKVIRPVVCSDDQAAEKLLRHEKCNPKTGVRKFIYSYRKVDKERCRCVSHTRVRRFKCRCPPNRHTFRKCLGTSWKTTTKKTIFLRGQCTTLKRIFIRSISCPDSRRRTSPCRTKGSKAGFRVMTVTKFWSQNCKCQQARQELLIPCMCSLIPKYRTRRSRRCVKTKLIHKTVYYSLRKGVCLRRVKSSMEDFSCPRRRRTRHSACSRKTCTLYHYNEHLLPFGCRCRWKLIDTRKVSCCCPRSKIIGPVCTHNQVVMTKKVSYELRVGFCGRTVQTDWREVKCGGRRRKMDACNRKTCKQRVRVMEQRLRVCGCYWHAVRETFQDCCCPEPTKEKACDHHRGVITLSETRYKLVDGRCSQEYFRKRIPINCPSNTWRKAGECNREGRKMTTLQGFRRVGCQCGMTVLSREELECNCPEDIWTKQGTCPPMHFGDYRIDKVYGLRMNSDDSTCTDTVLRTVVTRCRCNLQPVRRVRCIGDAIKEITTSTWQFDATIKTCVQQDTSKEVLISCKTTKKRTAGTCHPDGYQTDTLSWEEPYQCHCRKRTMHERWPCDCEKVHPLQQHIKCSNNNHKLITATSWYNVGQSCARRLTVRETMIDCHRGVFRSVKPCSKGNPRLRITYSESRPVNCKCRLKVIRALSLSCKSHKSKQYHTCRPSSQLRITVTTKYRLQDDIWKRIVTAEKKELACHEGKFKHITACHQRWGTYLVTTTRQWIDQKSCSCVSQISKQLCDCACPPRERYISCGDGDTMTTTVVKYTMKNCRCKAVRKMTVSKVRCLPKKIEYGPCSRRHGEDIGYRRVTRYHLRRHNCKCDVTRHVVLEVCSCPTKTRKRHWRCVENREKVWAIESMVPSSNRKRCIWVETENWSRQVTCKKKQKIVHPCNEDTKLRPEMTVSHVLKECRCQRHVRRRDISCAIKMCPNSKYLVGLGKCEVSTCVQMHKYYKEFLIDGKCRKKFLRIPRKCCCPPPKKVLLCRVKQGVMETIRKTWRLVHGFCIMQRKMTIAYTVCSTKKRFKTTPCNFESLTYTVSMYEQVLDRHCNCVWRRVRVTSRRQCHCGPPGRTVSCNHRSLYPTKVIKKWRYVHRKDSLGCDLKKTLVHRVITCPKAYKLIGKCSRAMMRTIKHIRFHVTSNCRCRREVRIQWRYCGCRPYQKKKRICDKEKGLLKLISVKNVYENGECAKRKTVTRIKINCLGHWRLLHEGSCTRHKLRIYIRHRRFGCRCVPQLKSKRCHCGHNTPRVRRWCLGLILNVKWTYYARRAACNYIRRSRVSQYYTACPKPQDIRTACGSAGDCHRFRLITKYRVFRCRCVPSQQAIRERCCCPKPKTVTLCIWRKQIRLRRLIKYKETENTCLKIIREVYVKIACSNQTKLIKRYACHRGSQISVIRWNQLLQNCICATKLLERRDRCHDKCPKDVTIRTSCSQKTCENKAIHTTYRSLGSASCIRHKHVELEKCCCPGTVKKRVCIQGSWFLVFTEYKFDITTKFCRKYRFKEQEPDECSHHPRVVHYDPSKCDPHTGYTTSTEIFYANSHDCQCTKRMKVKRVRCACPTSRKRTECRQGRFRVIFRRRHFLRDGACVPRIDISTTETECPLERTVVSRCNPLTCRQSIHLTVYRIRKCRCIPRRLHYARICCCPTDLKVRLRRCNGRKGIIIYYVESQRLHPGLQSCQFEVREKRVKVLCASRHSWSMGSCNIRRNNRLYARKIFYHRQRVGCLCYLERRVNYILCGCPKRKVIGKCSNGVLVKSEKIWKLTVSKGHRHCVLIKRKLQKRLIHCRKKIWHSVGDCVMEKGQRLVSVYQERRTGCRCKLHVRRYKTQCSCKRMPAIHEKSVCKTGQRVITNYRYRLVCKAIWNCACHVVKTVSRIAIHCKKPWFDITNCISGSRHITSIVYAEVDCHCLHRHRTKEIACEEKCADYLPKEDCLEYERGGVCESDVTIKDKLCRRTCGACFSCDGSISYKLLNGFALRTDKLHDKKFHLRSSYGMLPSVCREQCSIDELCNSFDYIPASGEQKSECIFNAINVWQLKRRIPAATAAVQAKAIVFNKICLEKCPIPKLFNSGKGCQCFLRGTLRFCVHQIKLIVHEPDPYGRCRPRERAVITPCISPCMDLTRLSVCERAKKHGHCRDSEVRIMCNKTCHACHCPSTEIRHGQCKKSHNDKKWRRKWARYRYTRWYGLCIMDVRTGSKSCVPKRKCQTSKRMRILPCLNSVRIILIISHEFDHETNRCRRKVRTVKRDCTGCTSSVKVVPGLCLPVTGHEDGQVAAQEIQINYYYYIRLNECCTLQYYSEKVPCSKTVCPKSRRVNGPCFFHERLHYHIYFVFNPESKRCHLKVSSYKMACLGLQLNPSDCRDWLPRLSCKRMTAMCHRTSVKLYCRMTCGVCHDPSDRDSDCADSIPRVICRRQRAMGKCKHKGIIALCQRSCGDCTREKSHETKPLPAKTSFVPLKHLFNQHEEEKEKSKKARHATSGKHGNEGVHKLKGIKHFFIKNLANMSKDPSFVAKIRGFYVYNGKMKPPTGQKHMTEEVHIEPAIKSVGTNVADLTDSIDANNESLKILTKIAEGKKDQPE